MTVKPTDPDSTNYLFIDRNSLTIEYGAGTTDISGADEWTQVGNAVSEWDDPSRLDLSTGYAYGGGQIDPYDESFQVHFSTNVPASHTWRGRAYITYNSSTGEITDADIVLNDTRFNWSTNSNDCGNNSTNSNKDVRSVVTHELGHAFGIGHWFDGPPNESTDEATMASECPDIFDNPDLEQRTLETDDDTAFDFIYGTDGVRDVHGSRKVVTGIKASLIPRLFELHQNYPNPFNPATSISFDLASIAEIEATIYSIDGQLIFKLIENLQMTPGRHEVIWNGQDQHGKQVASGTYVLAIRTSQEQQAIKITLAK